MSMKERRRLEVVSRVKEGQLRLSKAGKILGLSYRQMKRVYRRYREEGDAGLVHRNRGRQSNRAIPEALRRTIIKQYREKYCDFGPTLACEYLASRDGYELSDETLRQWLLAEGVWRKRRKRTPFRQWRSRRQHVGELVQMDGSHHDWFEGRGPKAVLMVMIDDATNRTFARFSPAETTRAAFETFLSYANRYGLPQAVYVDKDSIYRCERQARVDEELKNTGSLTQFGRAMEELGVDIILANSPQAKGRVERRNAVLQDRLVKALRMENISAIERANEYLEVTFLPDLNTRFTVEPCNAADFHRPIPNHMHLEEVLCFEEPRTVHNDWTVRWHNTVFQLTKSNEAMGLVKQKILVRELLDGTIKLVFKGHSLSYTKLPQPPKKDTVALRLGKQRTAWIPPADHPWRRYKKQPCPEAVPSGSAFGNCLSPS